MPLPPPSTDQSPLSCATTDLNHASKATTPPSLSLSLSLLTNAHSIECRRPDSYGNRRSPATTDSIAPTKHHRHELSCSSPPPDHASQSELQNLPPSTSVTSARPPAQPPPIGFSGRTSTPPREPASSDRERERERRRNRGGGFWVLSSSTKVPIASARPLLSHHSSTLLRLDECLPAPPSTTTTLAGQPQERERESECGIRREEETEEGFWASSGGKEKNNK